jgi:hypothetical protein
MTSPPPSLLEPSVDELAAAQAAAEPHPHVWRGLALGLLLAVAAWLLLAAAAVMLYSIF